jgi:hypothetical protein
MSVSLDVGLATGPLRQESALYRIPHKKSHADLVAHAVCREKGSNGGGIALPVAAL